MKRADALRALLRASKPGRVRGVGPGRTLGERRHAGELELRVRAKDILAYTEQKRFPLVVNGILVGTYVADFHVVPHLGRPEEVHEVKGSWTTERGHGERFVNDAWPLKSRLFRACYPDIILRVFRPDGREVEPPKPLRLPRATTGTSRP